MPRRSLLAVAVAAWAAGCSCGGPSVRQFDLEQVAADCARAVRCGEIGRSEEARCRAAGERLYEHYILPSGSGAVFAQRVESNRVVIDGATLAACLDEVRGRSCAGVATRGAGDACARVYRGNVKQGDTCDADGECAGGFCVFTDGCSGSCAPYRAPLAACSHTFECDPAQSVCLPQGSGLLGLACASLAGEGAPCAPVGCGPGLVCLGGSCRVRGKQGDACSGPSCGPGLFCHGSQCSGPLALGAACTVGDACADASRCVTTGADGGECRWVLDVGSPCDPAFDACPSDAKCDPATRVCVSGLVALGTPCTFARGCGGALPFASVPVECDPATSTCAELLAPGDDCAPLPDGGQGLGCFTGCDPVKGRCVDNPVQCR